KRNHPGSKLRQGFWMVFRFGVNNWGLNSEKYLSYLLECLPNEETLVNKEVLEAYLPWTKVVQEKCK
ncbi:hypothetical protein RIT80_10910, partial [Streptococcus pneumoniae]|uniref:hypothetical protein n=1 Tax=Streptococcus pneumoniae TaxID=1313 RepID=UPI00285BF398